jgi:type III restriction enzyme
VTTSFEVAQPILNSPYEEPNQYWHLQQGTAPELREGRREAGYFYRDPRADDQSSARGDWIELELVNMIRERVADWRAQVYPGTTRTSRELLSYWRREGRQHRLFFAQLESAETIVFLKEARSDLLQGVAVPPELVAEGTEGFTRYACKMATGSGKTTVMAMLAAWSILNKVTSRGDARFSDVVLVVCPNVTIRNRLRELDPNESDASIYRTRDLVPQHLMSQLRRGRVLVKNWHEFERKGMSAGAKVQKNGVPETNEVTYLFGEKTTTARGKRYLTREEYERRRIAPGFEVLSETESEVRVLETRYVESDTALMRRLLGRAVGGKENILVLNDEAHHAYRLRQTQPDPQEDAELPDEDAAEELVHESTVWVDGLDRIHKHRRINLCVDLSATPYFLARAGEDTNRVFPWVVSDFGLTDAIESGLVKIPQLAVADPTGSEEPKYFNIWRWILAQLTAAERGGRRGNPKPEAVLRHAQMPIELMGQDWRGELSREGDDDPRPPVFILVCKNTKLAKVVYEWLAEGQGPANIGASNVPELRNNAEQTVTIRVDSKVVHETDVEGARSDESAWMRLTLDTVGKLDWPRDEHGRAVYPDGFELLAKKLGRPLHPPGRDVRCIVSVGMLTEGWDCQTVTHIVGLRPFMSQLLCEQVVGRGLRRRNYDIGEDGKLSEEVAKILGVPFEVIPFKQTGKRVKRAAQHHVHAMPEKKQFEIVFPRVEGFQQAIRNRVGVRWDRIAPVNVDPMKIPDEVLVKGALLNHGRPTLYGPGRLDKLGLEEFRRSARLQERVFEMAAGLTREYARQESCEAPPHVLFPQMLDIVQRFVREKVHVDSEEKRIDVFLAPYWGYAIERLTAEIRPAATDGELPELPRYERARGPGSTGEVDFWTVKEVREAAKTHLNWVVADTKQWEQSAAYRIDTHPRVTAFVKNQGLGFGIPYIHGGSPHDYIPDFILRLGNGVHLILETKGADELEEVKAQAAYRWCDAVNADGAFGEWRYEIAHDMNRIPDVLDGAAAGRMAEKDRTLAVEGAYNAHEKSERV